MSDITELTQQLNDFRADLTKVADEQKKLNDVYNAINEKLKSNGDLTESDRETISKLLGGASSNSSLANKVFGKLGEMVQLYNISAVMKDLKKPVFDARDDLVKKAAPKGGYGLEEFTLPYKNLYALYQFVSNTAILFGYARNNQADQIEKFAAETLEASIKRKKSGK
jgi:hypothetical protein